MTQKYCVCPGKRKLYCVVRLIGLSGHHLSNSRRNTLQSIKCFRRRVFITLRNHPFHLSTHFPSCQPKFCLLQLQTPNRKCAIIEQKNLQMLLIQAPVLHSKTETNVRFGSLQMIASPYFNCYLFIIFIIILILILRIILTIIIITYSLNENVNPLLITQPQLRILLNFTLLHYALEKLSHFVLQILLHFAS